MICNCCNKELSLKDFFGKDCCYKCVFEEKLKKINLVKKITNSTLYCKICNVELSERKMSYCSKACTKVASRRRADNYWTRKIDYEKPISWRKKRSETTR